MLSGMSAVSSTEPGTAGFTAYTERGPFTRHQLNKTKKRRVKSKNIELEERKRRRCKQKAVWGKGQGLLIAGPEGGLRPQGAEPSPLLPCVAKGRKKSFQRGNYPPPPHWDGRAIQPNHIKFRTCSALAPM
jgi:hypothetical protein